MKIQLKKRLLCGVLAAVLILLPLPGCGEKQQDAPARVTLAADASAPAAGAVSGKISAPAQEAAPVTEAAPDKKSAPAQEAAPTEGAASDKISAPAPASSTAGASASAELPTPAAPVDARQSETASQSSAAVSAPPAEAQQVTVYVTNTGSKYHRSGCQYLAKSRIEIDLTRARQHYGPCSKCGPPV